MIKNLLFDLGGVIMDIRREDCVRAKGLGMVHPEDFLGEYSQKGPFMELEEGKISPGEFRDRLRSIMPAGVTDLQIDEAFCDFLVGIPVARLRELESLRKSYNIYLLSNTNAIMWDSKIADEFMKDGHNVDYYFDGMVTSFEAKSLKPSPEIFHYLVDKLGLVPSETLFFDDSEANVKAARSLGFNAVVVRPGDEFANLLSTFLSEQ